MTLFILMASAVGPDLSPELQTRVSECWRTSFGYCIGIFYSTCSKLNPSSSFQETCYSSLCLRHCLLPSHTIDLTVFPLLVHLPYPTLTQTVIKCCVILLSHSFISSHPQYYFLSSDSIISQHTTITVS